MAEAAFGAVRSLLGRLRDEATLLLKVGDDVQFIREEMESMESFIQHLVNTTPPSGEHGPPVRTWMKQVCNLAFDCSNCVDLYVRTGRGAAALDEATFRFSGLVGYLKSTRWWSVSGLYAQRQIVDQIRELKVRARDISERRVRYGVELPRVNANDNTKPSSTSAPTSAPVRLVSDSTVVSDDYLRNNLGFSCPNILEEKANELVQRLKDPNTKEEALLHPLKVIAVVASDMHDVHHILNKAYDSIGKENFDQKVQLPMLPYDTWAMWLSWIEYLKKEEEDRCKMETKETKKEPSKDKTKEELSKDETKEIKEKKRKEESKESKKKEPGKDENTEIKEEPYKEESVEIKEEPPKEESRETKTKEPGKEESKEIMEETCNEKSKEMNKEGPVKDERKEIKEDPYKEDSKETKKEVPGKEESKEIEEEPPREESMETKKEEPGKDESKEIKEEPHKEKTNEDPNQEEGLLMVLCDILNGVLPTVDWGEKGDRQKMGKDDLAKKISDQLRLKGKKSMIVVDGLNSPEVLKLLMVALRTFGCAAGSVVVLTSVGNKSQARIFCKDVQHIITHSLVDFFYEKAILVVDRCYHKPNDYLKANLLDILYQIKNCCKPDDFCMKMFVHYLYAAPDRSKEDVENMMGVLVHPSSLGGIDEAEIRETNGKKLVKFFYEDMPRTYRTCLLYMAIFPEGEEVRRARLTQRWITEGLITGKDMAHAVQEADRCFNTLINRWFLCPVKVGITRIVKSCVVTQELVKELITAAAREEQFLDPRLSRHLAQHFSVHSDIILLQSDTITNFMESLHKKRRGKSSSQLSKLKVVDLEGYPDQREQAVVADGFSNKHGKYVKSICSNMLLLKYLSLRNTRVTRLPKEINKLLQLEILDIRQTKVDPHDTKNIMLPKLKRLLAGHSEPPSGTSSTSAKESSVHIPLRISKMINMEVLSHVNVSSLDATMFEGLGRLWQLRKLGVHVSDHLEVWLKNMANLNEESLRSLSIHVDSIGGNNKWNPDDIKFHLQLLETLRISGRSSAQLLQLFIQKDCCRLIARLTLRDTMIDQTTLNEYLARLPTLRCLKLRDISYINGDLCFSKNSLPKLKFLVIEHSQISSITFQEGASPMLEKIVWFFTETNFLNRIDYLPNLKELHLNDRVHDEVIIRGMKEKCPSSFSLDPTNKVGPQLIE